MGILNNLFRAKTSQSIDFKRASELREMLNKSIGQDLPIYGGKGLSMDDAIILDESLTDSSSVHLEYYILGAIYNTMGVPFKREEQVYTKKKGRKYDVLTIRCGDDNTTRTIYFDITGPQNNKDNPVKEVLKAIENGKEYPADVYYNIGLCYHNGVDGLSVNIDKAVEYYTKASEKGHPVAQLILSQYYKKDILTQCSDYLKSIMKD